MVCDHPESSSGIIFVADRAAAKPRVGGAFLAAAKLINPKIGNAAAAVAMTPCGSQSNIAQPAKGGPVSPAAYQSIEKAPVALAISSGSKTSRGDSTATQCDLAKAKIAATPALCHDRISGRHSTTEESSRTYGIQALASFLRLRRNLRQDIPSHFMMLPRNLMRQSHSRLIDARAMRAHHANKLAKNVGTMAHRLLLRWWIEIALGVVSAIAFIMTLVMPDWIERRFGFEPDGGDGSTEWGLAIFLAIATLGLFFDAHRLRSRTAQASVSTK